MDENNSIIMGINATTYILLFIIQLILIIFMIWFSINVINKCNGKPAWLTPVVLTLLILWLLIVWANGSGLILFVTLLIILIIQNSNCK